MLIIIELINIVTSPRIPCCKDTFILFIRNVAGQTNISWKNQRFTVNNKKFVERRIWERIIAQLLKERGVHKQDETSHSIIKRDDHERVESNNYSSGSDFY